MTTQPDALDGLIEAAVQALDLPLEPAWQPAIKANLAGGTPRSSITTRGNAG